MNNKGKRKNEQETNKGLSNFKKRIILASVRLVAAMQAL